MRSDGAKLRGWWEPWEAVAQMAEVLGTNLETQDLLNDGREVRQRANDPQRRSLGGTRQAPRGGESQRVLDHLECHAACMQLHREQTVRAADRAASTRSGTVSFQKPADPPLGGQPYSRCSIRMSLSLGDRAAKDH